MTPQEEIETEIEIDAVVAEDGVKVEEVEEKEIETIEGEEMRDQCENKSQLNPQGCHLRKSK